METNPRIPNPFYFLHTHTYIYGDVDVKRLFGTIVINFCYFFLIIEKKLCNKLNNFCFFILASNVIIFKVLILLKLK